MFSVLVNKGPIESITVMDLDSLLIRVNSPDDKAEALKLLKLDPNLSTLGKFESVKLAPRLLRFAYYTPLFAYEARYNRAINSLYKQGMVHNFQYLINRLYKAGFLSPEQFKQIDAYIVSKCGERYRCSYDWKVANQVADFAKQVEGYITQSGLVRNGLHAGQASRYLREIKAKLDKVAAREESPREAMLEIVSLAQSLGPMHPILKAAKKCLGQINRGYPDQTPDATISTALRAR